MSRRILIFLVIVVVVVVVAASTYTVPEWQQAVVIELGSPVGQPVTSPGLHFKVPFIQRVHLFEKRILEWDGQPEVVPTNDSKFIYVDTFARWRISNALTMYEKVVNEAGAQTRLDDILDGLVRDTLSAHTLPEIVRSSNRVMDLGDEAIRGDATAGLGAGTIASQVQGVPGLQGKLTHQIMDAAQKKLKELNLGISLVDLEIKRLDYTKKVLPKVYARMISQQFRIAEKYRALGQGKKAEVAGKLTEETDRIHSEAYKKAQNLKGEGEAEAAHIYARAYRQDPEFYKLWGTLRTYRGTLDNRGVLVLSTDSDLYRYLKKLQ